MKHAPFKEINKCRKLQTRKCKDYAPFYHIRWTSLQTSFYAHMCVETSREQGFGLFPSLLASQCLEQCLANRRSPIRCMLKDWLSEHTVGSVMAIVQENLHSGICTTLGLRFRFTIYLPSPTLLMFTPGGTWVSVGKQEWVQRSEGEIDKDRLGAVYEAFW